MEMIADTSCMEYLPTYMYHAYKPNAGKYSIHGALRHDDKVRHVKKSLEYFSSGKFGIFRDGIQKKTEHDTNNDAAENVSPEALHIPRDPITF